MKRILSLILSVAMIFSMIGTVPMASAAEETVPFGGYDYAAYPEEFEDYTLQAGSSDGFYWDGDVNVWENPWDRHVVVSTLISTDDGATWTDDATVEPGQTFLVKHVFAQNNADEAVLSLELVPILRRSVFTIDQSSGIFLNLEADGGYVDDLGAQFVWTGNSAGRIVPDDVPMISLPFASATGAPIGEAFDMCQYAVTAADDIADGQYTITTDLWGGVLGFDTVDFITQNGEYAEPGWGVTVAMVIVGDVGGSTDPEPEPEPDPVPATAPEVTLVAGANAVVDGWNVTSWNATKGASVAVNVADAEGFTSTVTVAGEAYTAGDAIELAQGTYDVVVTTTAEGYIDTVTEYTITVPAGTFDKAVAPTVTLVAGANSEVDGWNVTEWNATKGATVKVNVADVAGFASTVTVNGAAYTAGDEIALAEGTIAVEITTSADKYLDTVTNYTIAVPAGYFEDAVAPEVTLVAGDNATVDAWAVTEWNYTKGATVSVAVADAEGFASTVTVNGEAYTAGDAIELAEGTYKVIVTTSANKYNTVSNEYTITVPAGIKEIADAPELTLVAGENVVVEDWDVVEWNATKGGTVSIEVVDVEGFTTTLTVNDEPYTPGDPIELAEGDYDVVVTTTADRYITRRATRFFLVYPGTYEDAVAPEVTLESITAPVNGWTVDNWKREIANKVAVAVADVEGFTSTVTVNGEAYTAGDAIEVTKVGQTFAVVVTTSADKYNDVVNTYTITVGEGAMITSADIATMPTITMSGSEGLEFVDVVTPNTGRGSGAVRNWQAGATVAINVADNGAATSTIIVNGEEYVSGDEIVLDTNAPLCVIVQTTEDGKISATKVYDIVVTKADKAILNSVTIDLNGTSVDLTGLDSTIRNVSEELKFVKGGANEISISALAEEGATVSVKFRDQVSAEPLTAELPYAAQFTAVVIVEKAGRQTAYYVIDIPVKQAGKAPLDSVVISGIGEDVIVEAPVATANGRNLVSTVAGFVKGENDTITIAANVADGLEAVITMSGNAEANALTATLPYAAKFTAVITVSGEGYETAYYVIDIPVAK